MRSRSRPDQAMLVDEYEAYAPAPAAAPAAAAPAAAPLLPLLLRLPPLPHPFHVAAGEVVAAPMPGNILKRQRRPGSAAVKAGDVLVVLEAMKMENEILGSA